MPNLKAKAKQVSYVWAEVERMAWQALGSDLPQLFPGKWCAGRRVYDALNTQRGDRHAGSFKIHLDQGWWKDFATGTGGKSAVTLYGWAWEGKVPSDKQEYADLAKRVARFLGIAPQEQDSWQPRQPVVKPVPKPVLLPFSVAEVGLPAPLAHPKLGKPSVVYKYTTGYQVYRFDHSPARAASMGRSKDFRPCYFDGQQWQWGDPPQCLLPLYRKTELRPDQRVIITEGEKAADAARCFFKSGFCTTTSHGAQSPKRTDFTPLFGHDVLIFPDNDLPGWLYADEVASLLKPYCHVKVVYFECHQVPPKFDLADALAKGWSKEELTNLLRVEVCN